ncbi:MAG: hypothetical protein O3C39_03620 [Planctomycetota bacterium]|jgi:hypothetical protein|nr:hypothetical protein [Planctomycetota bacterium]MDA1200752.1 hypothetical protein [Planctomycetota bacterium]
MLLLAFALCPMLAVVGVMLVLGVAAAAAARLTEGTRHEAQGQWLCLSALALMGTVCGFAIQCGPDAAAAAAATLAVMTLITVADFSPAK